MEKQIILIGGTPTIGKSELARKLSERLKFPWISTDAIRDMMRRLIADKKQFPFLSHFANYTAEEYLSAHTPQEIVDNQNKESREVWLGVKALIDTDYSWGSFIVEGVAILPELVHRDFGNNKAIKPIFLVTENKERIRKIVFERGLWDEAPKYADSVKEVEVKWAYLFSKWLHGEALRYGYPVYEIENSEFPLEKIIELIKLKI